MKKITRRIVSILIVSLLLALLCCLAVACGNDSKSNTTTKTATNITVTVNNESYTTDASQTVITVSESDAVTFLKSDFTVTLHYSDGTSKDLSESEYSLDTSALPSPLAEGTYPVTINYNSLSYAVTVVVTEDADKTLTLSGDAVIVMYDGTEKSFVAEYDKLHAQNKLSAMISAGKVTLEPTVLKETNAGSYVVTVSPAPSYKLNMGIDESINIAFVIQPAVIVMPTVTGKTSFEYDGMEKSLTVDLHGFDEILRFDTDTEADSRKRTDVGFQNCTVHIKAEHQNNYAFDRDGRTPSSEGVNVGQIAITKKTLSLPTVVGKQKDENGFYHFTYTGEPIAPELSVGTANLVTHLTEDGLAYTYPGVGVVYEPISVLLSTQDYELTDAMSGFYPDEHDILYHTIRCSLTSHSEAYVWEGTESNAYEIRFVIDRATTSLPEGFAENFKLKYVYSSQPDEIANQPLNISPNDYLTFLTNGSIDMNGAELVTRKFLLTDEVKTYIEENNLNICENINLPNGETAQGNNFEFTWASNATLGENNIATVGTYRLPLLYRKGVSEFNNNENYEPIRVEIEVEVLKGHVYFTFDPNAFSVVPPQTGYDYGNAPFYATDGQGNAIVYSTVAELTTYGGFDGLTLTPAYTHYYSRSGEENTFVEVSADDLNQAGYYKTVVHAVGADENVYSVSFLDGTTFTLGNDTPVQNWTIQKRGFYCSQVINRNADFNGISYYPEAYYTLYAQNYGNVSLYDFDFDVLTTPACFVLEYKEDEEDEYEVLEPIAALSYDETYNGYTQGYDMRANGFYRATVRFSFDADNMYLYGEEQGNLSTYYLTGTYSISVEEGVGTLVNEWQQNRNRFGVPDGSHFYYNADDLGHSVVYYHIPDCGSTPAYFNGGGGENIYVYMDRVEYKASEEDEYGKLDPVENTETAVYYDLSASGFYRFVARLLYDTSTYCYVKEGGEISWDNLLVYEFSK